MRRCLHLRKASLRRLLHRCPPLAPLSPPAVLRSLRFRLPQLLQHLDQPLAPLSLPAVQRSLRFRLPHHPPKLRSLQFHPHSHSPPHNRRLPLHRTPCNHSPERFNPWVPRFRPRYSTRRPRRMHLSPELPNLSILLPPPPQDPWQPEHLRNQALTALNCLDRYQLCRRLPQLLHQHPRLSQPAACLPLRHLPPSCPHLPSLQPWKKFRLSPHLRPPCHSLPHVDCSARRRCRFFRSQCSRRLDQNLSLLRLRPPRPQLSLRRRRLRLKCRR